jgi:hypothetical protein
MDKKSAKSLSNYDWFDCEMTSLSINDDPYDISCLSLSLQGEDKATCQATVDQNGQGCEFCFLSSVNLCLTFHQTEIAEHIGGDCGGVANLVPTISKT